VDIYDQPLVSNHHLWHFASNLHCKEIAQPKIIFNQRNDR